MIQLYATTDKRIPLKNTKELNPTKWIRITADENEVNHNDSNSPTWTSPRFGKIDQLPRDYGVGRYTPGPIIANKPVKVTVVRGNQCVFEWTEGSNIYEVLCVHIYGAKLGVVPAGQPICLIDKERHLHASGAINGKPVTMDKILGEDPIPQPDTASLIRQALDNQAIEFRKQIDTLQLSKQDEILALKTEFAEREAKLLAEIKLLTDEKASYEEAGKLFVQEKLLLEDKVKTLETQKSALEISLNNEKETLKKWRSARKTDFSTYELIIMLALKLLKK